jgi:hypothetical protein
MKRVRITKLNDDFFKNLGEKHPNGINKGYVKEGVEINGPPKIGKRYCVNFFSTSPVVEIIDENTIKITYSTYKIEYLN